MRFVHMYEMSARVRSSTRLQGKRAEPQRSASGTACQLTSTCAAHTHVCVCYAFGFLAGRVNLSVFVLVRACLCFAHSCLIYIPSEAHLVCFEEAGGAAAAGALRKGWASSRSSPLTH